MCPHSLCSRLFFLSALLERSSSSGPSTPVAEAASTSADGGSSAASASATGLPRPSWLQRRRRWPGRAPCASPTACGAWRGSAARGTPGAPSPLMKRLWPGRTPSPQTTAALWSRWPACASAPRRRSATAARPRRVGGDGSLASARGSSGGARQRNSRAAATFAAIERRVGTR